jgi:hypothetical protein
MEDEDIDDDDDTGAEEDMVDENCRHPEMVNDMTLLLFLDALQLALLDTAETINDGFIDP